MTFSKIGRILTALIATAALGLGMTACGGGTIGYLYVAGTYYNQISGFKIDDYTGNLTPIDHTPFSSGGTNPVTVLIKTGGRFVYVINTGTAPSVTPGAPITTQPSGSGISVYSVGGDGVLTYQTTYQSQGVSPIWATFDNTSNYLYVLDKYSPYYNKTNPATGAVAQNASLTAFSVDGNTGRLTLVTNSAVLDANTHVPLPVFEVGPNPIMSKVGSGNCLFTLSANSIFPYVIGGSGQLTVATTGSYQVTGATNLTSINTSQGTSAAAYIYLTDAGTNQIFSLTAGGSACSLAPVSGSYMANLPGTANPVNSLTSTNGKYLYVLNQSSTNLPSGNNAPQSTISAFDIATTGVLTVLPGDTNNPYAVGSGPVCLVQDPTGQYLYISNNTDSTITGKLFDSRYGTLANLSRGSVFTTTMRPTCLAVSGNV